MSLKAAAAIAVTLTIPAALASVPASPSGTNSPSEFSYDLRVSSDGYKLKMSLLFSPGVTFPSVIAQLKDPHAMARLNPSMLPTETSDAQDGGLSYRQRMGFKLLGMKFRWASDCSEKRDIAKWTRHCDLDLNEGDAARLMKRKMDEVTCETQGEQVRCEFAIDGDVKAFPFVGPARSNVKAKHQALLNWGRFFYMMETADISSALALERFDRSPLKKKFDELEKQGREHFARDAGPEFAAKGSLKILPVDDPAAR